MVLYTCIQAACDLLHKIDVSCKKKEENNPAGLAVRQCGDLS